MYRKVSVFALAAALLAAFPVAASAASGPTVVCKGVYRFWKQGQPKPTAKDDVVYIFTADLNVWEHKFVIHNSPMAEFVPPGTYPLDNKAGTVATVSWHDSQGNRNTMPFKFDAEGVFTAVSDTTLGYAFISAGKCIPLG